MWDIQNFNSLIVKLASPDTIRAWSYGEVKKPETINYRTLRPEKDGLFCERIFGTTKEWECYCGKFKSVRYKGVICDRCGVEVTHFKVRRERIGHIELATPVSHIWYYRSVPSRMGLLLDLQVVALRAVLYYEKYIVIDPGDTDLKKKQLLTEDQYIEARERYSDSFSAGMGAEAIKTLLENLDIDILAQELRAKMIEKGVKNDKRLLKRIEIAEHIRASGNKCSWMILDVIPVIPPELRPMVQLDGGRFATSDLNDLYRRVINRNNRLKRLLQLAAPDIIIRNEKRMLQEAVDALFDNSKRRRVKGVSNRPLKSISDMLKGKQGRFRQNLLGKRVDYSGRSVIVVGPELKLWQCGLPTKMALELFKPFIMKKLVDKDMVSNVKKAKMFVEQENPMVFQILDEVTSEHPVILNRAPTLHRLSIQAFEPVLVEGKAIKLHPLVCHAFNADFDGDQMAIHIPLTHAAQMECWTLMLSARNLLDPANGKAIVYPSQDMVLGIYYLTKIKLGAKGSGKRFSNEDEAMLATDIGSIDWQAEIEVPIKKSPYNGALASTTVGRIVFNQEMPKEIEFANELLGDKELKQLIEKVHYKNGPWITVQMLDAIKTTGYKYATFFGATISMDDIIVPTEKATMIGKANQEVDTIQKQYHDGVITQDERYNRVCDVWSKTNEQLTNIMMNNLEKDKNGFNTVYMMAISGARGSRNQIRQLAGMRGLMAKPNGDIIDLPIRANFKEGLSVIEFFISTNGARKGLSDTALKTADAGYLTRRLVDIAQDVVINEDDCGTINGVDYTAVKDGDEIIEPLKNRIAGKFTQEQVLHPITGELICDINEYITDELAVKIDEIGVERVNLRTVLTCESRHGVCCKCYGRNLARNKIVEIGEAVGIIAAQSIGQPGTQLTMRTFHVGGTASKTSEENRIVLKYPIIIKSVSGTHVVRKDGKWLFTRKGTLIVTHILCEHTLSAKAKLLVAENSRVPKDTPLFMAGNKTVCAAAAGNVIIREKTLYVTAPGDQKIEIQNGSLLFFKAGDIVPENQMLSMFDAFSEPIIAEVDGYTHFEDIIVGSTLTEELDKETGNTEKRINDLRLDIKQPRVLITDEAGNEKGSYYLPGGAVLLVNDNDKIYQGDIIAKMPKESFKTNDITGGLPRVSELFEARRPKYPAVLSQISGTLRFKGITKGKRVIEVVVDDEAFEPFEHTVPMTQRLLVRDGDYVEAGDRLCDGAYDPHDILTVLGERALQNHLMDEIQQVYRMQGVDINDKHIGVIIRQMLRRVGIVEVGDTVFIYGQQVDKYEFHEENRRVVNEGGQPAIARPVFQGITKASLNINSFISAAAFQETTRVLTNSAIAGASDNLRGLKENVIIGHLIPAGTGIKNYHNMKLFSADTVDLDVQMNEILERRRIEKELSVGEPVFEEES
ncbi:DNA-directed RNA polymerase subunit beta' [Treponema endosymbiont of Eucomonympha sp.]|uniref:DNA-directed RNA polymerase subunit beta' n=1 Tax=Treponema endosymbiont of Eucomonympha sp. TaxID=1580831 RepID=UPI000750C607|nr:DNA-directed RNA polymerase subunit beta' [Treponema endosymbiont of Eucomonympha sp.]